MSENKGFDWKALIAGNVTNTPHLMYGTFLLFLAACRDAKTAIILGDDYVIMDARSYTDLCAKVDQTQSLLEAQRAQAVPTPDLSFIRRNAGPGKGVRPFDYLIDLSARGKEWVRFCERVLDHIEGYTVPQYGDLPNDQISSWSVDDVMQAIRKRTHRHGKNSRGPDEDLRDCLKIAHEACIAYFKIVQQQGRKK